MDITRQKETITIKTGSRLDANTAPELADQIATMQFEKLVVDMADTAYVSSAGLRALMIGKRLPTRRARHLKSYTSSLRLKKYLK